MSSRTLEVAHDRFHRRDDDLDRPVHEVFAYAIDPDKLPTWQTNTVSARREDDGPYGLGSRLHEVHRAPGGKELASVVEVVEFEPDRVFALEVKEARRSMRA